MQLENEVQIILNKGSNWQDTVFWIEEDGETPISLDGYTATLQIRQTYDSEALITLTESDGLTITGSTGRIDINISAERTASLPNDFEGVYELKVTSAAGTLTVTLLEGSVKAKNAVVHDD